MKEKIKGMENWPYKDIGPEMVIMVYIRTNVISADLYEISAENKEKLFGYQVDQMLEKSLLGTVTPQGHLPREGTEVWGSQERDKEADRLNPSWQSVA